jgi:hypothetical protein
MLNESKYKWDQALLEYNTNLNTFLVSIIAFSPESSPSLIGTGFIIQAVGASAIVVTAAHIFEGIKSVQNPYMQRHSTTLAEFMPAGKEVSLDSNRVGAIYIDVENNIVEVCKLNRAIIDYKKDIALFEITATQNINKQMFKDAFLLDDILPNIGDEVVVLGYAGMQIDNVVQDGKKVIEFVSSQEILMRKGKITHIHQSGPMLKGKSFETNIPIFGGMSGGPVFRIDSRSQEMRPFALISSDLEAPDEQKNNREISGQSIVIPIDPKINKITNQKQGVTIRLTKDTIVIQE